MEKKTTVWFGKKHVHGSTSFQGVHTEVDKFEKEIVAFLRKKGLFAGQEKLREGPERV